MDLTTDLILVIPEIVLALGALAILMVGVFRTTRVSETVTSLAIVLLLAALAIVVLTPAGGTAFGGVFVVDGFARFMKALTLIGSIVAVIMTTAYARAERFDRFEYPVLIVIASLGMMIMISSNDMLTLYLGLELQSLSLYVIAAINRDSTRSTEAGLKYFVLGALSSGMMLYGISLIYGFTGTISFPGIAEQFAASVGDRIGFVFGMAFVMAGLCFKISAVPFHMWTPDVYEGAPTPVTAFLSAAPKMAAMALVVRVVIDAFGPDSLEAWRQILVFVAIMSMVLAAFAAIGQRNLKRLLAYSSIGHVGYALVGLSAGTEQGVTSVIVYMTIYLVMTLGVFAVLLAMRREDGMVETVDSLSGLSKTQPLMAFALAMLMFSMAGIPPLAGFFAKYYVFLAAIEADLIALAVIGVLASAVAAYYYLRIVKVMYFDEPEETFDPMATELRLVLGASAVFVLFAWMVLSPLTNAAGVAARSLF